MEGEDGLKLTHHSEVTPDQIDHLGHMNVRYYGANASAGGRRLVSDLGGPDDLALVDAYTRHHNEQFAGTPLVVRSAVIDADPDGLRLYHELAPAEGPTLGATFVHRISPRSGQLPADVLERASACAVPIPDRGRPRSLRVDGDPGSDAPPLDLLVERGLAMRKVRTISPDECDDDGRFRTDDAPMLTWGGEALDGDPEPGPLLEGSGGRRMGWASMETRMVIGRLPVAGDRVQSFGAVVSMADKTSHSIFWAYDVDRGHLATSFQVINLCFDLDARKAMSIPQHARVAEERYLHADLAPHPPST